MFLVLGLDVSTCGEIGRVEENMDDKKEKDDMLIFFLSNFSSLFPSFSVFPLFPPSRVFNDISSYKIETFKARYKGKGEMMESR